MADFNKYFPILLEHEGGYVNNPRDRGGRTKYGVTEAVWKKYGNGKDVKDITKEDAYFIYKSLYWNKIKADSIINQSIAEFMFDWAVNSGPSVPIKRVQKLVGVKADGIVGPITLKAINTHNQHDLFDELYEARENFYIDIVVRDCSQVVFLKGWFNRLRSFTFKK